MIGRRRFLSISAAFAGLGSGVCAAPSQWQGRAFGGDISITLSDAPPGALDTARNLIRQIEEQFSLFDAQSALSRLNRNSSLADPDPAFLDVLQAADEAHKITEGAFDPTIQPLWQATARGEPTGPARAALGWHKVRWNPAGIRLAPGQALTFNGIAQGYATDRAAEMLKRLGATQTLVNIGEHRALGGPFRLGLSDPTHGHLGTRTLTDRAIATSSPGALALGADQTHILAPSGLRPLWSTVSVIAASATQADALSTAFCMLPIDSIHRAMTRLDTPLNVTLVDDKGDLITL